MNWGKQLRSKFFHLFEGYNQSRHTFCSEVALKSKKNMVVNKSWRMTIPLSFFKLISGHYSFFGCC